MAQFSTNTFIGVVKVQQLLITSLSSSQRNQQLIREVTRHYSPTAEVTPQSRVHESNTEAHQPSLVQGLMEKLENIYPNVLHGITNATSHKVVEAAAQDGTLMTSGDVINFDWPEDKIQVPHNVRDYWPYREPL